MEAGAVVAILASSKEGGEASEERVGKGECSECAVVVYALKCGGVAV